MKDLKRKKEKDRNNNNNNSNDNNNNNNEKHKNKRSKVEEPEKNNRIDPSEYLIKDLFLLILSKCSPFYVLQASCVSKRWNQLSK